MDWTIREKGFYWKLIRNYSDKDRFSNMNSELPTSDQRTHEVWNSSKSKQLSPHYQSDLEFHIIIGDNNWMRGIRSVRINPN